MVQKSGAPRARGESDGARRTEKSCWSRGEGRRNTGGQRAPRSISLACQLWNSSQHGRIQEAQKKTLEDLPKTAHRIFPPREGRGAAQRSYQRGLKSRGNRKHQRLQFLLRYSCLFSSQNLQDFNKFVHLFSSRSWPFYDHNAKYSFFFYSFPEAGWWKPANRQTTLKYWPNGPWDF